MGDLICAPFAASLVFPPITEKYVIDGINHAVGAVAIAQQYPTPVLQRGAFAFCEIAARAIAGRRNSRTLQIPPITELQTVRGLLYLVNHLVHTHHFRWPDHRRGATQFCGMVNALVFKQIPALENYYLLSGWAR